MAKNGRKVKAIAYFFAIYCRFSKMKKVAKNGRNVKAIYSLTFLPSFATFSKMKKIAKINEKLKV